MKAFFYKNRLLIFVVWFGLLTYASVTPNNSIPNINIFEHFDKLVHLCMYLGLSFLMAFAFIKDKSNIKTYFYVVVSSTLIGGIFELVQKYITFDRSASWLDFAANMAGSFLGVILFDYIIMKRA